MMIEGSTLVDRAKREMAIYTLHGPGRPGGRPGPCKVYVYVDAYAYVCVYAYEYAKRSKYEGVGF